MRLCRVVLILTISLVMLTQTSIAEQMVALGCEKIGGDTERKQRYVFLYGSSDNYNQVCLDNVDAAPPAPVTCHKGNDFGFRQDALHIGRQPTRAYSFVLHRKSGILLVNDAGSFFGQYAGDVEIKKESLTGFHSSTGQYQCTVSPDAQSTLNYVQNAKNNQLNTNKF